MSSKREPGWGSIGSLEMLLERNEPRQGCCQLTGKSEKKRDVGDSFKGLTWDKLLLPIALLVASLVESLRV